MKKDNSSPFSLMSIIALLTDFGLYDSYVASVKGVILKILKNDVRLVDISHLIPAGDIRKAGFSLFTAYKYFPERTVFFVVIDPGVGSKRKPIIVETPDYFFVGPDNGVFSWIYQYEKCKVYEITDIPPSPSNTFHGRDIFAPVSAKLSTGIKPANLGIQIEKWKTFNVPVPIIKNNTITGEVIDIDRFGNIITSISEKALQKNRQPVIKINNRIIKEFKTSYEGNKPIAIIGSSGFLEISLPNGNCAKLLNVKCGMSLKCKLR